MKLTSGEYVAPPKEAPAPKAEGKPKKGKRDGGTATAEAKKNKEGSEE